MSHALLYVGHAPDVLRTLQANSVHCIVTSPPYWGLRDYDLEPQTWGGDPACAHEWTSERRIHRGGGSGGGAATVGRDQSARNAVKDRDAGAFCACGAWCGHLGLEPTPDLYLEHMVGVFRELRRVLRRDGTVWLNMGDCYTDSGRGDDVGSTLEGTRRNQRESRRTRVRENAKTGLKPKQLVMMPARLALALQDDGWWVRAEIVWSKPNPMPESVTDRPTRSHEYVFLLAKSERYFYDAAAIAEPVSENTHARIAQATIETQRGGFKQEQYNQNFPGKKHRDRRPAEIVKALAQKAGRRFDGDGRVADHTGQRRRPPDGVNPKATLNPPGAGVKQNESFAAAVVMPVLERNSRTVWEITTQPYPEAHFATFPEELARRCILAGSSPRTCEKCGAPWKRVVEARGGTIGRSWHDHEDDLKEGQRAERWAKGNEGGYHRLEKGWKPTCRCEQQGTGRSIVLDPFGGSGTVAQVATGNGRDSIYIDLNPKYPEMARQRIGPLLVKDGASEPVDRDVP